MTQLTPALDAALREVQATVFGAVTVELPGYTLNLLDGSGQIDFAGRTFVGEDATFGVLADIENLTDGTGDQAPALAIGLLPSGDSAAASLAAPTMQGSRVLIYFGAVNTATGQAIPDPQLIFLGELDVPTLRSAETGRRLDYEIVSVFERLFEDDGSARFSPGHHRSIFPNEAGFDFVTGVREAVYWGVAGNPGGISNGSGGGGSGGSSGSEYYSTVKP